MPSKIKKPEPFSVSKAVKKAAREVVGTPRPTREIPDAKTKLRQKAAKHKPTLGELTGDE